MTRLLLVSFFFFNDTATTEIYTLSLHDALPILCEISGESRADRGVRRPRAYPRPEMTVLRSDMLARSEEHTSELQSHLNLVCRLLLEKKKNGILNSSHYLGRYIHRARTQSALRT